METLYQPLDTLLGLSLRPQQLEFWQIGLRAILVYLVMIVFVRAAKKRFLSSATAFDAILVIVIGSTAARAITGNSPFFGTLAAVYVLIALHWIISYITCDSPSIGTLVKGNATVLIRNGRVDRDAMKAAHMSSDDLEEDLRQKGVDDPRKVKEARLERSGDLSVVKK
jgi:uncharacterized membrane protein YcaP (DUF421 family)